MDAGGGWEDGRRPLSTWWSLIQPWKHGREDNER